MFKKLLKLSAIAPLAITPMAIVSCSSNANSGTNEDITDNNSYIKKIWNATVISEEIVEKDPMFASLNSSSSKENAKKAVAKYILTLDATLIFGTESNPIVNNDITQDNLNSIFDNYLLDAWNFYVAYKTEATENGKNYFYNKVSDGKTNEFETGVITDDLGKPIANSPMLSDVNVGINYLPPKPTDSQVVKDKFETDFKILFATPGLDISNEILNLVVSRIYFLQQDETSIKNGTNYTYSTKGNTLKSLNNKSIDVTKKDYFLVKYLLDNKPIVEWSYLLPKESTSNPKNITSLNDFNLNSPSNSRGKISSSVIPASKDVSETTPVTENLKSFINVSSSKGGSNDLSDNIEDIKSFGYEKSGMYVNNKAQSSIQSFENLESLKWLSDDYSTNGTSSKYFLPSVEINSSSLNVGTLQSAEIEADDLIINGEQPTNGIVDTDSNNKWEVIKVFPAETSDSEKYTDAITVSIKYSTKGAAKTHVFYYDFIINYKKESTNQIKQESVFDNKKFFNLNEGGSMKEFWLKFPATVMPQEEDANYAYKYYLRILPNFIKTPNDFASIDDKKYNKGFFSLEGTSWSSENEKKKLSYLLSLSSSNDESNSLSTQIQDYFLYNGIEIKSSFNEFATLIEQAGLAPKTQADRDKNNIG